MNCNEFRIEQISADEYHSRPEISHGAAKCFSKDGPWEMYHRYILRSLPAKESSALNLGRAFHAAVENPEAWDASFVEEPRFITISGEREPINKRKKAHREFLEEWEAEQRDSGRTIIRAGGFDDIHEMVKSMRENPAAVEYMESSGHAEIAGFANEETTGLGVKALADLWVPDWPEGATIVDFKTTEDSTPEAWARKALGEGEWGWGYNFQAAWYTDIFHAERFVFVIVRSKPPWECWVRQCNPSIIGRARKQNLDSLRQIKQRMDADDWHNNGWGAEYPLIDEEKN